MAQVVLSPNVDAFVEQVLHAHSLRLKIEEVKMRRSATNGCPWHEEPDLEPKG